MPRPMPDRRLGAVARHSVRGACSVTVTVVFRPRGSQVRSTGSAIRSGDGDESWVICGGVGRCTECRRGITMLRKIRIALVVTIMAVAAVSSAGSASALGFYRGGDFGYFGFGGP